MEWMRKRKSLSLWRLPLLGRHRWPLYYSCLRPTCRGVLMTQMAAGRGSFRVRLVLVVVATVMVVGVSNGWSKGPSPTGVIAGAANLPGAFGSDWHTDVYFHNASGSELSFMLRFEPRGDLSSNLEPLFALAAGETLALKDVVASEFAMEATGALHYTVTGGDASRLLVEANTFNRVDEHRRYGQQIPGVGWDEAAAAGEAVVVPARGGRFRTNVGFVPGEECSAVDIRVLAEDGSQAASESLSVTPLEWYQLDNVTSRWGLGDSLYMVEVSCIDGPLVAYASMVDNISSDGSYHLGQVDEGLDEWYWMPGAALTSGAHGSDWHSDLVLGTGSALGIEAQLSYYPRGDGEATTRSVLLAGQTSALIEDVLGTTMGLEPDTAGGLNATAKPGQECMAFMRTYTWAEVDGQQATYGQYVMPRARDEMIGWRPGKGVAREGRIIGWSHDETSRANLILQNTAMLEGVLVDSSAEVVVTDEAGNVLGNAVHQLAPGEYFQLDRFVEAYDLEDAQGSPVTRVENGTVIVRLLEADMDGFEGGLDARISEVNGNDIAGSNDARMISARLVPMGESELDAAVDAFIEQWFDPLLQSYLWLNQEETRDLLGGSWGKSLGRRLYAASGSPLGEDEFIAELVGLVDGDGGNGEIIDTADPCRIDLRAGKGALCLSPAGEGEVCHGLDDADLAGARSDVRSFFIERLSRVPGSYGGDAVLGPDLAFDPTWQLRDYACGAVPPRVTMHRHPQQAGVLLQIEPGWASCSWSNGASGSSTTVDSSGSFWVEACDGAGCCAVATVVVDVDADAPALAIDGTGRVCSGDEVVLTASAGFDHYFWSNGDVGPATTITGAGTTELVEVVAIAPGGLAAQADFPVSFMDCDDGCEPLLRREIMDVRRYRGLAVDGERLWVGDAVGVSLYDTDSLPFGKPIRQRVVRGQTEGIHLDVSRNLLAVASHQGGVHLLEADTLEEISSLQVVGEAWRVWLDYPWVYVANWENLVVTEIDGQGQLAVVAELETTERPWDLLLDGDVLYVSEYRGGLAVVDVSNPLQPSILQYLPSPISWRCVLGLALKDGFLYAGLPNGVWILEQQSNGTLRPVTVDDHQIEFVRSVEVLGDNLLVGSDHTGVTVLEISPDGLSTTLVEQVSVPSASFATRVFGDQVVAACDDDGLRILDIARTSPSLDLEEAVAHTNVAYVESLLIKDDVVFVARGGKLQALTLNDDGTFTVAETAAPQCDVWELQWASENRSMILAREFYCGAEVFRIGNDGTTLTPEVFLGIGDASYLSSAAVVGDDALMAYGSSGYVLFDIADPSAPVEVEVNTELRADEVVAFGDSFAIVSRLGSVTLAQPSGSGSLVVLSTVEIPEQQTIGLLSSDGQRLFVMDMTGTVHLIGMVDNELVLHSSYETSWDHIGGWTPAGLWIDGERAGFVSFSGDVTFLDIVGNELVEAARMLLNGTPYAAAVDGTTNVISQFEGLAVVELCE